MSDIDRPYLMSSRDDEEDNLPAYYPSYLSVREVGEISKVHALIALQGRAVCTWLECRKGRGINISQEVSSGLIFKRKARMETRIETW